MAIDDREETIDEKPSTYNKTVQMAIFAFIIAVLIVLLISTFMRLGDRTEVSDRKERDSTLQARQSPEQEQGAFDSRFKRAQDGRREPPRRELPDVIETLRAQQQEPAPAIAAVTTPPVDEWIEEERDRVRAARYDDYVLDLGFSSARQQQRANPARASMNGMVPGPNKDVTSTIANVQREIDRVNRFKQQLEQGGARSLPAVGNMTAVNPTVADVPLVLGRTRTKSVEELPQPGQKLLPVTAVIRAALDQKVMSDYTGPYRARVLDDVYDVSKRYILIPKGSTIDGRSLRIANVNEPIQARMAMTVNWIVLPNGHKIDFSRQYALDREGVAAIRDKVNRHFLAQFLGVAAYAVLTSESSRSGSGFNSDRTLSGDIGESARREFAPLAEKYLNLVPTITLRPGTPLRIYIAEELYIDPWSTVGEAYASRRRARY